MPAPVFVDGVTPLDQAHFNALGAEVDAKVATAEKGVAGGVATLDGTGHVPAGQLPGSGGVDSSTILLSEQVYEPGVGGQTRAGHTFALDEFVTMLGLTAPIGLYNLGTLNDISGNARHLTNRGAVAFVNGIAPFTGANAAAQFTGADKALYVADTGGADPFRIKYGTWGCWFRTAKRSTAQKIVSKWSATAGQSGYFIGINAVNMPVAIVSFDGTAITSLVGTTDMCDDRWHFLVAVHDGVRLLLYVDSNLEASMPASGAIFGSSGAFNIGGYGANAGTAVSDPIYGRVDEVFVTGDILTPEQIRVLYCAKIPGGGAFDFYTLAAHRLTRGGAPYFSGALHAYEFVNGSLNDGGSLGTALTNNNGADPCPSIEGVPRGAFRFDGVDDYLSATDAGLPAGTATRTMGCWFRTNPASHQAIVSYGTAVTDFMLYIHANGLVSAYDGVSDCFSGSTYNDGLWHFVVVVADNAAPDGVKRKLYIDGRLVGSSTTLAAVTLFGANGFRVGNDTALDMPFKGEIDGVFITNTALDADALAGHYDGGSANWQPWVPKDASAHIEGADIAGNLYLCLDTIDPQNVITLIGAR